ncbi:MAG: MoaD/ThiS family protein [Chloroflexi bacterium]|nr:MoaD/ThiS family protein [Chloroflexota bacterium]
MSSQASTVKVRLMGELAGLFHPRELELPLPGPITVGEFLRRLSDPYGDAFSKKVFNSAGGLTNGVVVFVNGEDVKGLGGLDTPLPGGIVELIMLPVFEGG